jgi:hypothetical protein
VFLISYLVLLFAWPYYGAQFWLPVIPLVVTYSVLAIVRPLAPKLEKIIVAGHAAIPSS